MKTKIQMSLLALLTAGTMLNANTITGVDVKYSNNKYKYYTFTVNGDTSNIGSFQLYIDTDNDPSTSYDDYKNSMKGADLKIIGAIDWMDAYNKDYSGALDSGSYSFKSNAVSVDVGKWLNIKDSFKYRIIFEGDENSNWKILGSYSGSYGVQSGDEQYLYQDGEIEYWTSGDDQNIGIYKPGDGFINTWLDSFYINGQDIKVKKYNIKKQIGGFDIVYTLDVKREIAKNSSKIILSLQVPGIQFNSNNNLSVLNPLYKHYLEDRDLEEEKEHYNDRAYWAKVEHDTEPTNGNKTHNKHFPVANSIRMIEGKTYMLAEEAYGTQFVYSPVIVATDTVSDLAIGSSLNIDFKTYGIGTKMYIDKKDGYWNYRYDLIAFKNIQVGKEIEVTIPIRFSTKKNWIFTLHPYKEFFNKTYEKDEVYLSKHKKDVRPIQAITFSYPDVNSSQQNSRNWAWYLATIDGNLQLRKNLNIFGEILKKKGFQRSMIWNFTGTYTNWYPNKSGCKINYNGCIQEQLPFQFLDNPRDSVNILQDSFAQDMRDIMSNSALAGEFEGIEIGYDWGISGQIPVEADGTILSLDTNGFQPHHLASYTYGGNAENYNWYVNEYLNRVRKLGGTFFEPKFIRLDALNRMENLKNRLNWLKAIRKALPDTKLAAESSIDYMHAKIGMINQLDSTESYLGIFKNIDQPDFLAMYLNPGMENIVNLDDRFLKLSNIKRKQYVWHLAKLGYTPLIKITDKELLKDDQRIFSKCGFKASKDINMNAFVDVIDLDKNDIHECLDNDGYEDWPYTGKCRKSTWTNE